MNETELLTPAQLQRIKEELELEAILRSPREVIVCDCGCGEIAPLIDAYKEGGRYFYNEYHAGDDRWNRYSD